MKAIVAVSFGTSVPEAGKAIENVENALKQKFDERDFFRAFTSKIICKKLRNQGEDICGVTEILKKLAELGYTDILIQPTHIIPGHEYDKVLTEARSLSGSFEKMTIGAPLINDTEDLNRVAEIVYDAWMPKQGKLILMGHGTDHRNNIIYPALQTAIAVKHPESVLVATVEGWPEITDILDMLKKMPVSEVTLAPFMLVAGDHARNDMAGGDDDSWKSRLEKEGYKVNFILDGLGMIPEIRNMYVEKAVKTLEK